MKMIVKYPFRDRETGEHRKPGQEIEVTKARGQQLIKAAVAEPAEAEKKAEAKGKKAEDKSNAEKK
ncbi:MAG: hypothetical protein FH749_06810 [Firmicutes bacterium]|nr:hypothetical protein [Bacillota bacterium]